MSFRMIAVISIAMIRRVILSFGEINNGA